MVSLAMSSCLQGEDLKRDSVNLCCDAFSIPYQSMCVTVYPSAWLNEIIFCDLCVCCAAMRDDMLGLPIV